MEAKSTTESKKKPRIAKSMSTSISTSVSSSGVPITVDGAMPQKRFYRCRAHCNPLSHNDIFQYPARPDLMDWSSHYPHGDPEAGPHILDMGCGFGGLTVALSTLLPHKRILGMEIRAKVAEYVRLRILACRQEQPGSYDNCSVLRGNSMKYMPNFFRKASLDKIFICFPDPHFKRKNHPRRIVSDRLLSEYAFFLNPQGGRLYTITDVEELHHWHLHKCRAHPLFRELTTDELDADPCVQLMYSETEEGKKVQRCKGNKYYAVFERLSDTESVWKEPLFIITHNFWNMGTDGSTVDE